MLATPDPPSPSHAGPGSTCGGVETALLLLHRQFLGEVLECLTECPACRQSVEFSTTTSELLEAARATPTPDRVTVNHDHCTAQFRLPVPSDLDALPGSAGLDAARRLLFTRCFLSGVDAASRPVSAADLADDWIAEVSDCMAAADPGAAIEFDLTCPYCGARWEAPFDAGRFLWEEVHWTAKRLLREVHDLARAYGWSEQTILDLAPARRAAYLELLGS